jgi:hypothetical protein
VCDLNGVYALKLSVPVTWPGTSLIQGGNGTFVLWMRVQLSQSGTSLSGNVIPCGQTVPDFSSTPVINEKYGLTYPTTIFDRVPPLPSVPTSGTLGGTSPGSAFALARSAWLSGATMADPINGAWPNAAGVMQLDSDADGKKAVTGPYKSGSGYAWPPTNNFASSRANRDYIAARIVFTLGGTLTSCTQASGAATAQDIDYHTLGCRLTSGSDCGSSDSNHLDTNGPNYQTGAATYTLTKLTGGTVCSDVRAALP